VLNSSRRGYTRRLPDLETRVGSIRHTLAAANLALRRRPKAIGGGFIVPKQKENGRGKRRTRAHGIADLAVNHIERHVLLCGHTLQRIVHDYGLDAMLTTFNRLGEAENALVWLQIKATDHPDRLQAQDALAVRVEREHLLFWTGEIFPVLVVVYDGTGDQAHWLHVREEFGGGKLFEAVRAGVRLTLRVPLAQVLDHDAIAEFRRGNARVLARFGEGGR
jgi:hypothetical protein